MVLVNTPKRTAPLHHKKRTGQHHKQTRRYEKPYWPYLPILLVIVFGLCLSSVWSFRQRAVLGYSVQASPAELLASTNQDRLAAGDRPLSIDSRLNAAAQAKAQDMATHNYWAHTSPSGEQPWQFIAQSGYQFSSAGENLAYGFGSGSAIVAAWMNSAEHRMNMLNAAYGNVGFGIVNAPNYLGHGTATLVVAMYAQPAAGGTGPQKAGAVLGASTATTISRIQMLTNGNAPWSLGLVAVIAFAAGIITAVRHGLLWRKALARGEAFVSHHHVLDVLLICIGVAGFVLTRSAGGLIH